MIVPYTGSVVADAKSLIKHTEMLPAEKLGPVLKVKTLENALLEIPNCPNVGAADATKVVPPLPKMVMVAVFQLQKNVQASPADPLTIVTSPPRPVAVMVKVLLGSTKKYWSDRPVPVATVVDPDFLYEATTVSSKVVLANCTPLPAVLKTRLPVDKATLPDSVGVAESTVLPVPVLVVTPVPPLTTGKTPVIWLTLTMLDVAFNMASPYPKTNSMIDVNGGAWLNVTVLGVSVYVF